MMHFARVDYILVILYLCITFALGVFYKKELVSSADDYLLAGRRVSLPAFVATLVSSWYGGILGVGEFTYRYGIVNWVTQGLFYYIAVAIFGLFIAKRVQASHVVSIPERLEQTYGKKSALVGAFFTFLMVNPAPYILIVGILLQVVFGWSFFICLLVGTAFSALYLFIGGFKAVVRIDCFHFVLMFLGIFVIIPASVKTFGGLPFLEENLPAKHLTMTGELGFGYIFAWGLIALWTLIDPGFYQRCFAARSGVTAQRGVLISIVFWMIFDACTCTAGLYARAVLPGIDPVMAYPLLAERVLPAAWKGLFYIGMLATVMSTLVSTIFLAGVTIGNDFIGRLKNVSRTDAKAKNFSRIGLLIALAGAVGIAWISQSVIAIWYTLGTIAIPALLVPVLVSFLNIQRIMPVSVFCSMLCSGGCSALWLFWGYAHIAEGMPQYPFCIEPMYPGLLVSLIFFIVSLFSHGNRIK